MKIAYVINQYPKVSHSFIRREIEALEKSGIDIQRISLRDAQSDLVDERDKIEERRTQFVLSQGPIALVVATFQVLITRPKRFLRALLLANKVGWRAERPLPVHWIYLLEACVITRWITASGAAHIHAHFGSNSTEVAMLTSILTATPYSFTAHGSAETTNPVSTKIGEKVRRAKFVVAVSSYGRSQLFRWVEYEYWHKVHVIHCGLEPEFHEGFSGTAAMGRQLVCVGRLSDEKGQLLLLSAFRLALDQGLCCKLVLAGDGDRRPEIESRIAELGLQDSVRITGWLSSDQVRDEMLAARALVLPSFSEGLPVVIMEAMALSRPVIATYVGGVPELVRQGNTGWLVPASDVEALAQALLDCFHVSTDGIKAMGSAAHERVLAGHEISNESKKLLTLFQNDAGIQRDSMR